MLKKNFAICMALGGLFAASPGLAQGLGPTSENEMAAPSMEESVLISEGPPMMGGPGGPMGMGVGGGGRHHGHHGKFEALNLTDDQYERMYQIKKQTMSRMGAKFSEMMAMHLELQDAMLQPELDKAKLTGIQARINALHADISSIRFDSELSTMAVLTPEQRKDMRRALVKKMADGGMGGMCGHGGP